MTTFTPLQTQPPPSAEPGSRRRWMWIVGILVIVGAALAALALWGVSIARREDIVEGFARFPPGCASTIDVAVPAFPSDAAIPVLISCQSRNTSQYIVSRMRNCLPSTSLPPA